MADDAELVRRARAGDRAAFAVLVERHRPLVRRLCRRALGDRWHAEDAEQETLLLGYLHLHRLREPTSFGAWLAGIALNLCRRSLEHRRQLAIGLLEPLEAEDAEAIAEAAETTALVRRAVADLPQGQREAVVLYYLQGLTQLEVAAELAIPVTAVKTRLHKARRSLRIKLAGIQEEEERMEETRARYVEMQVIGVGRYASPEANHEPRHVVELKESGGDRTLPIWIGPFEATGLALRLEKAELPRPDTYQFTPRLLSATGQRVREVRIERLADEVFYAVAAIEKGARTVDVDARPSDALNLALLEGCPIRASADVLETALSRIETPSERLAAASDLVAEAKERATRFARPPASAQEGEVG